MKFPVSLVVVGLVVTFGFVAQAGEKPPVAFINAMKAIGTSLQGASKSGAAQDFAAVKQQIDVIKKELDVVVAFWDTKKNSSATGLAKDAIKAASDLEAAAVLEEGEGVTFAMKELQTTCTACHTAHREQLPDGSFEIK